MLDNLTMIEIKGKQYPIAFTFNVLEQIQETYGSFNNWSKKLTISKQEPNIKDLIWTIKTLINEGIDIMNEDSQVKSPLLTQNQVGRLIDGKNMGVIVDTIQKLVVRCMKTNNNPN